MCYVRGGSALPSSILQVRCKAAILAANRYLWSSGTSSVWKLYCPTKDLRNLKLLVCTLPPPQNHEGELKMLSLGSKTGQSMSSKTKEASFHLDLCLWAPVLPFSPQSLPCTPHSTLADRSRSLYLWTGSPGSGCRMPTLYKLILFDLLFFFPNQDETGQHSEKLLGQLAARWTAWQLKFCSSKKGDNKVYVLYLSSEFGGFSVHVSHGERGRINFVWKRIGKLQFLSKCVNMGARNASTAYPEKG